MEEIGPVTPTPNLHSVMAPTGKIFTPFADGIANYIFLTKYFIKIPLKFVPKGSIGDNSELVEIMAWHEIDNKPLPQPVLT